MPPCACFTASPFCFRLARNARRSFGGKILTGDDHRRRMSRETDRLEVPQQVVFHVRRQHRRRDMRAHAAGEQGVAVRRGARDAGRADRATGAADILDH